MWFAKGIEGRLLCISPITSERTEWPRIKAGLYFVASTYGKSGVYGSLVLLIMLFTPIRTSAALSRFWSLHPMALSPFSIFQLALSTRLLGSWYRLFQLATSRPLHFAATSPIFWPAGTDTYRAGRLVVRCILIPCSRESATSPGPIASPGVAT